MVTPGSSPCAAQPATGASAPDVDAREKEVELDHGAEPSDVSLVGAVHGERWCFPGVGHAPEFLVPVEILGRTDSGQVPGEAHQETKWMGTTAG